MDFKSTDVLIVGAGPVGLVTALGLAHQGIPTIIIGKLTDVTLVLGESDIATKKNESWRFRSPLAEPLVSFPALSSSWNRSASPKKWFNRATLYGESPPFGMAKESQPWDSSQCSLQ